jgi:hypothetical protein
VLKSARKSFDDAGKLPDNLQASIAATLDGCRRFVEPNFCWKAVTRNGSLASVVVVRENIKGNRATVHLSLRLKNGEIRSEKERLVRTPKGWLFGDPSDCDDSRVSGRPTSLSNPRLQRTPLRAAVESKRWARQVGE